MTGYRQSATPHQGSRIQQLRARLPGWAQRFDPRLLIGGAIAALVVLCCCCCGLLGLAVGGGFGGNDDSGGPDRPTQERSVAPSESDSTQPAATPTSTQPSSDAAPRRVIVPNVIGDNAAIAEDKLKRAGFTKLRFASGDAGDRVVILRQNWRLPSSRPPRASGWIPKRCSC